MAGVGDPAAVGSLVLTRLGTVGRVGSVSAGVLVPSLEQRRHCGRSVRPQWTRRCTHGLQSSRDRTEQPRSRSTLHAERRPATSGYRQAGQERAGREEQEERKAKREASEIKRRTSSTPARGIEVVRVKLGAGGLCAVSIGGTCAQSSSLERERVCPSPRAERGRRRAGRPRSERRSPLAGLRAQ